MQELASTIEQTKMGYRTYQGKSQAFEAVLRDRYEQLHNAQSSTRDFIEKSFPALAGALSQPAGVIDKTLLINYINELLRFVENVGLGMAFARHFIDRAIETYRQMDQPLLDLYLAKVSFLRLNRLEDPERETTLLEAKRYAQTAKDKEGLLRILIRLAEYYTEISLYQQSLRACREGEHLILSDPTEQLHHHYTRVLINFGMNYTTLFLHDQAEQYLLRAKVLLEQELQKWTDYKQFHQNRRMATVLHYLGRIALAKGRLQDALFLYVTGQKYQDECPLELSANAFYHLRMGELLLEASLLEQASDHIKLSQQLFDDIGFSSSGRLQVSLAWALIANKRGQYKSARETIEQAYAEAHQRNFSRGELWCLVKLFWLELQHFRIHRAIYVFLLGMKTWQRGELKHNGSPKLLGQYVIQVILTPFKLLQRSPHTVMGAATFNAPISTCICPIHFIGKDK